MTEMIPFNRPYLTGDELSNIVDAHSRGQLAGDGFYTRKCHDWLEHHFQCKKALLTHSCTAALEMSAILLDIKLGDEVIMPSYTFVSTANAFVSRGATPVFVDIREDTLNINELLIEAAITSKTKAIVVVHYAGVACEMDVICEIARSHGLYVVEDAAQALMASYHGQKLGTHGDLSCFSFHETKNIICGEGGALIINNQEFTDRAEIIREKGTNRSKFFRGQVDKYTWVDVGSSYLPGELNSAFLLAQFRSAELITSLRKDVWLRYYNYFSSLSQLAGSQIAFSQLHTAVEHNAHIFYVIFKDCQKRDLFIDCMRGHGVQCVFHYVPLHTAPAGILYSRTSGSLQVTDRLSSSIVRLPLFVGVEVDRVLEAIEKTLVHLQII
jgi:dTDP-4-amino-4,6-dideoxygalactose transaminase